MKEFFAWILLSVGSVVVGLGISWVATGNDFFLYRYFAPKRAAVEREVFENTPSYILGGIQELRNMQLSYIQADAKGKSAMRSIILHRADQYDEAKLPADIRSFLNGLRANNQAEVLR